jgi:hypothetical protein
MGDGATAGAGEDALRDVERELEAGEAKRATAAAAAAATAAGGGGGGGGGAWWGGGARGGGAWSLQPWW